MPRYRVVEAVDGHFMVQRRILWWWVFVRGYSRYATAREEFERLTQWKDKVVLDSQDTLLRPMG